MLDALDKDLLKTVADLEDIPKGAYNIRKNGKLLSRATSANINIESNAEGTGIIVTIAPGTAARAKTVAAATAHDRVQSVISFVSSPA